MSLTQIENLQSEIEDLRSQMEELKQMIREAEDMDDLRGLQKHVGPTEDENQKAQERLKRLDEIAGKCAWDKFESQCSHEEMEYRGQWYLIMEDQGAFEAKYC